MGRYRIDVAEIKEALVAYLSEDLLDTPFLMCTADTFIRMVISGKSYLPELLFRLEELNIPLTSRYRYLELLAELDASVSEVRGTDTSVAMTCNYSTINGYVDIFISHNRPDRVFKEWLDRNRSDERFYTREIKDMINEYTKSMEEEYELQETGSCNGRHRYR